MKALHRAAAIRAYRTLATGLGGSAVTTAITGAVVALAGTDQEAVSAALLAAGASLLTTVVSAFGSFWRAVAQGLPEAPKTDE